MTETEFLRPIDGERSVNVTLRRQVQIESGRSDADHGCRRAVKKDVAADEAPVPAEAPFPQAFSNHGHRSGAKLPFFLRERPPGDRRNPKHTRQRRSYAVSGKLLRL